LGLGILGPGIANGLVSGGPQLGAGAEIGTGLAAGGVVAAGAGLAAGGAGLAGGAIAGAERGGGAVLSGASAAYRSGGLAGVAEAGASAAMSPLRRTAAAFASHGQASEPAASTSADGQSDWALRMKRAQTIRHGASAAGHAVRSGDHGGSGSSVDLSEGEVRRAPRCLRFQRGSRAQALPSLPTCRQELVSRAVEREAAAVCRRPASGAPAAQEGIFQRGPDLRVQPRALYQV
jgi:hypothetical protein